MLPVSSLRFLTYAVMFLITALLIIAVTANNVFNKSDKGIILLFFWLYGLSIFAFCYMVSAIFSKARIASTVGAVVFLLSFFPFYAVSNDDVSAGNKGTACLSTNICFALGAKTAIQFESAQQGVTNSNIGTELNNFAFGTTIALFIFDTILYMVLAFYFERVVPSDFGIPMKWYFCCLPSYWRKACG